MSTLVLKTLCITDGCTHMSGLNALHRHFKQAHMTGSYRIHPLRVLEAPIINNVEESEDDSKKCKNVTDLGKNIEGGQDNESIEENMDEKICENCHSPEAVEEGSANAGKEDDRNEASVEQMMVSHLTILHVWTLTGS